MKLEEDAINSQTAVIANENKAIDVIQQEANEYAATEKAEMESSMRKQLLEQQAAHTADAQGRA